MSILWKTLILDNFRKYQSLIKWVKLMNIEKIISFQIIENIKILKHIKYKSFNLFFCIYNKFY